MFDDIKKHLLENTDQIFYTYYGMLYDSRDVFTRLDKTYMFYLCVHGGVPVVRRIIPFVTSGRFGEPVVCFTSKPTVKITEGPREGRVVTLDKLKDGEQYASAVIEKKLDVSDDPTCLNKDNALDAYIIRSLEEFRKVYPVMRFSSFQTPSMYLCCPRHNLVVIPRKLSVKHLELPAYDDSKSFSANIVDNACESLHVDAGCGRVAWPFSDYYGKGVVASSTDKNGLWYKSMRKVQLERSGISIDFR